MPRGIEQFASTVSGSSRKATPSIASRSATPNRVTNFEGRDVRLDVLRNPGRQRLDAQLARDLLDDAALLCPGRLSDELHVHGRLDRAVEAHLVEVDVGQRAPDRVPLEVLENGVVRGRLPLDDHVDDRVETRTAGQRCAEVALADDDRARVTLPVEHAGHQTLLPETANTAGAELVGIALGDLESDAIAGHRRRIVAAVATLPAPLDEHPATGRVERLELCACQRRLLERLAERREEHHVARHAVAAGRKPASERPFLDEAERPRDPQARARWPDRCGSRRGRPDRHGTRRRSAPRSLPARGRFPRATRAASSRSRARPSPESRVEPRSRRRPRSRPGRRVRTRSPGRGRTCPRNVRRSSTFSSSGLGSSSAHGIHGRRWSRLESRASLSSEASRGSQQRIDEPLRADPIRRRSPGHAVDVTHGPEG